MNRHLITVAVCLAMVISAKETMAWCEGMEGQQSNIGEVIVVRGSSLNRVAQRALFQPAKPEAPSAELPIGRMNSSSADVFYNKWKIGGSDGATFGLNPSATFGTVGEFTLTAPIHIIRPEGVDNIYAIGLDGAYKRRLTGALEKLSVGAHAYAMGFFSDNEDTSILGGGPFISYDYRINQQWSISVGCLLEFTKPDEGDTISEIVPGVNVGYNLSDNVALNGYLIHYKNLDSDVSDDAYTDIGADVNWVRGTWSLSAGIKTATGLDNVDSTEIYLGSNWMF